MDLISGSFTSIFGSQLGRPRIKNSVFIILGKWYNVENGVIMENETV